MKIKIKSHLEKIRCPECKSIQVATVEHTIPFWSYVHECYRCNFIIMESEWINLTPKKYEYRKTH